jgi:phosphate starvation-inducible PhoH-like protein
MSILLPFVIKTSGLYVQGYKIARSLVMKKVSLKSGFIPKSLNQQLYVNSLNNDANTIVIASGPAGSGKSFIACTHAVNLFKKKMVDKIVITRPVVPVDEDIGFLPGSLEQKMDPWVKPIFDIFHETYSKTDVANMVSSGQIEIVPLAYMRGRTFKRTIIIGDEMQNSSPNQMLMLLTRVGENSKLIITGDLKQSDRQNNNGLKELVMRIQYLKRSLQTNINMDSIKLIELELADIQRNPVIEDILKIYDIDMNKPSSLPSTITEDRLNPVHNASNIVSTHTSNEFLSWSDHGGWFDAALIPKKRV